MEVKVVEFDICHDVIQFRTALQYHEGDSNCACAALVSHTVFVLMLIAVVCKTRLNNSTATYAFVATTVHSLWWPLRLVISHHRLLIDNPLRACQLGILDGSFQMVDTLTLRA